MSGLARDAFAACIAEASRPRTHRQLAWNHRSAVRQAIPHLILRARLERRKARSYRGFRVGCALLAYRPDYDRFDHWAYGQKYKVFTGYNVKDESDSHLQLHAEQQAIEEARKAGYTMVLAIVVVGKPQSDDATGVAGQTLRPCIHCRTWMRRSPIVFNRTIVLTVAPKKNGAREEFTVRSLMKTFNEPLT